MLTTATPPSADVDAAIATSNAFADAIRAELPALGARICSAAAAFATTWWEGEVRRVIEQDPERAMECVERLAPLKQELRALQHDAAAVATRHFAAAFTEDATAARVQEILHGPRRERDAVLVVGVVARMWEEPLRYVLGEIGDPLGRAGLTQSSPMSLDPNAAIDPNGRYRYALSIPEELIEATAAYEEKLKELGLALTDVDKLKREKLRQKAISLWDQV